MGIRDDEFQVGGQDRKEVDNAEKAESRNPVMHSILNSKHKDYELYQKAIGIIRDNLTDPDFNVAELTNRLNMNRSSFYRRLNNVIDSSPQQLIRDVRLSEAYYLLKESFGNVSEVAYAVGFNSIAYFSRCFKEEFNCSPSQLVSRTA